MAKEKTKKDEELLKKTIAPEEIITDDDSDMPQPETKVYKKYLRVTDKFMRLFGKCVGSLPYDSVIRNKEGGTYRLIDFVRFIENHKDKMAVDDMNVAISYIAQMDFSKARPLMEIIEDKSRQPELWGVFEDT
jgi:hypothetical protein